MERSRRDRPSAGYGRTLMAAGSASPSSGRWTAIALKFLVSFGVLAAFASVVDGPTLRRLLQEAHPGFIALLLLLVMVRMWIAALRLHLLLAHRASVRINRTPATVFHRRLLQQHPTDLDRRGCRADRPAEPVRAVEERSGDVCLDRASPRRSRPARSRRGRVAHVSGGGRGSIGCSRACRALGGCRGGMPTGLAPGRRTGFAGFQYWGARW